MTYSRAKVVNNGMGAAGFLCPPGHPSLTYMVEVPRRNDADSYSLTSVLEDPAEFPSAVVKEVRGLLTSAQLVCSEKWVRHVYGYFRNCYSPNGTVRDVTRMVSTGAPEHHLAVLTIREYFPDHQPRLDLIDDPGNGYGARPCTKCGQTVQYEARVDAHVVILPGARWSYNAECPNGGQHEITA